MRQPGLPGLVSLFASGKLFRFDTAVESPAGQRPEKSVHHVEFFWLCDECSGKVTLNYSEGIGLTTVSLSETQSRAASAS